MKNVDKAFKDTEQLDAMQMMLLLFGGFFSLLLVGGILFAIVAMIVL